MVQLVFAVVCLKNLAWGACSCRGHFAYTLVYRAATQRAQCPIIEEYSVNHNMKPYII